MVSVPTEMWSDLKALFAACDTVAPAVEVDRPVPCSVSWCTRHSGACYWYTGGSISEFEFQPLLPYSSILVTGGIHLFCSVICSERISDVKSKRIVSSRLISFLELEIREFPRTAQLLSESSSIDQELFVRQLCAKMTG